MLKCQIRETEYPIKKIEEVVEGPIEFRLGELTDFILHGSESFVKSIGMSVRWRVMSSFVIGHNEMK